MAPGTEAEANEEQQPGGYDAESPRRQSVCMAERASSDPASSVYSVEVLSTDIDPSILRGVSTHVILQRCGSAFRGHEFDPANHAKSFEAPSLDDFVSHDWASSPFAKVLTLCLVYNGQAAVAASLAVGVVLAAAESQYVGLLPSPQYGQVPPGAEALLYGYWCQSLCPLVYVLVFFSWQDVRAALRLGTRIAFLDKYCIDQADVERKTAGILSLGGFLRHTDRLIICWTPRYFTRLWCTYEVASWLFLEKPLSSVLFMPLSHAQSLVVTSAGMMGVCALFMCGSVLFPDSYIFVLAVAAAVNLPVATHFLRRFACEMLGLPKQLEDFSITRAACFCCSHGHREPSNPEVEIPCDRRLVCHTVARWFPSGSRGSGSSSPGQGSSEVEAFDSAVRELLGPWVLKHAGPTRVPYKYIVMISMPFAFRMLDIASSIGRNSNAYLLKTLVGLYPAVVIAMPPIMYKSSLHLVCVFESCVGVMTTRYLDVIATLCLAALLMLLTAALWVPINVVTVVFQGPLPTFAVAVLLFLLAALVFADDLADIVPASLRRCGKRVFLRAHMGGPTRDEESPRDIPSQEDIN